MVRYMQEAIELGRTARDRRNCPLRMPVKSVRIIHREERVRNYLKTLEAYMHEELNTMEIVLDENEDAFLHYGAVPDHRALGSRLGKLFSKKLKQRIEQLTNEELQRYKNEGTIELEGVKILEGELKLQKQFLKKFTDDKKNACAADDVAVLVDVSEDKALRRVGVARECLNKIQKLRKTTGLQIEDEIEIFYDFGKNAGEAVEQNIELVGNTLKMPVAAIGFKNSE